MTGFGQRQEPFGLSPPALQGADPRLHDGERCGAADEILGKHRFDEVGPLHAQASEGVGPEPFSRRDPTQGLEDEFPQPGWIVVLLVEGYPGEGQVGLFDSAPLVQERRLPVAGRGPDKGKLTDGTHLESREQLGARHLLEAGRRREQLGPDHPRRSGATQEMRSRTWRPSLAKRPIITPATRFQSNYRGVR
jgi:hypothetical protein